MFLVWQGRKLMLRFNWCESCLLVNLIYKIQNMFKEGEMPNASDDRKTKIETVEFFKNEEVREKHFMEGEKRIEENMKIARGKFSGEDEEWREIVDYIKKEAKNETDIGEMVISAKNMFSGLSEDCIYILYQAIILKLQLANEKKIYIVKKDSNK